MRDLDRLLAFVDDLYISLTIIQWAITYESTHYDGTE